MLNKTLTIMCSLMLTAQNLSAVENCTVARTANYKTGPDYQLNRSQSGQSFQLLLEISALVFRRGKNTPVHYELAKNVSYLNDGKTMRIEMRKNCGWSDGAPITAHELYEGIIRTFSEGPESSNVGRKFIKNGTEIIDKKADIKTLGVRVIDEYTLEIDLVANGALMEKIMSRVNYSPFPIHLSASEQENWAKGFLKRVSSGPYYVTRIDEKELHLAKNPYFCKDIQPEIENLQYLYDENSDAQAGLYLNKKINLAERFNNRTLRAFENREGNSPFKKREFNNEVVTFLLQASKGKLMDNPKLREALFLSIDLDQFAKFLDLDKNFLTQKGALSYPYPSYDVPKDPFFAMPYTERLARAKAIMLEQNITLENPIDIRIVVLDRAGFDQVKIALLSMWAQLGVNLEFQTVALESFSWKGLENWPGGYDYFLVGMESDFPDPADFLSWLNIHGADPQKLENEKRILSTFSMVNNEARLKELGDLEIKMRENRTILSLYATSTPWIIDNSLEFGEYFHLTGNNLMSQTCGKLLD